ncbi:MAG: 30S ribosomal protein S9 [Candidatus Uhrbacteria bacterium GW2011_GWD2_52_7]|uniref:Small ribosomal subunit protein uS9 n=1 Tax=Candidatus Uhrbacteria bacterium GW2011_GWD2_52_7 TaxID=1618989 RepID=A0A0G1XFG0_9BACT|nr:MAG: 30S ribosomal protein S9 [Candidatus Uhrbacteria bacterium GW2011_GWD2_52_7]
MAEKYYQAVGRRKTSTAQVRLFLGGSGKITVNGKPFEVYFPTEELRRTVVRPLAEVGQAEKADVTIRTEGGGPVGQSEASRLGIARALVDSEGAMRLPLKAAGLLTRDPRKKERTKFGKHGARRSPQWRKR